MEAFSSALHVHNNWCFMLIVFLKEMEVANWQIQNVYYKLFEMNSDDG